MGTNRPGGAWRVALVLLAASGTTGAWLSGCGGSSRGGRAAPPGGGTPSAGPPRLTGLAPGQGAPGERITLTGEGFAGTPSGNTVFFGQTQATQVAAATSSQVLVDVPPGASSGVREVTVTTAAGTSNGLPFTVLAPAPGSAPLLTALDPASGPPGATVRIFGSGFDPQPGADAVTFNGAAATVTGAASSELTVTVPAGATSGPVVVSRPGAGPSNGLPFTVTASQPPLDLGASGSRARDYLVASPLTHLLVEVDHVQGHAPDAAALDRLRQRLEERCHKPGGVALVVDDAIPAPALAPWTLQEVRDLERRHRDHYTSGNTAVLYFVYVDGGYETDTAGQRTLGISYTGSSLVIFKEGVEGSATALVTGPVIERAVLVHEAGHALGLVNNGTPLVSAHEDAQHPRHDASSTCVMFHAIETSLVSQLLGSVPDQFDAACVADLQAAGGK